MNERLRKIVKEGVLAGSLGGVVLLGGPLVAQSLKDFEIPNITWNDSNSNGSLPLEIKGDRLAQLAGFAVLDVAALGTVIFVSKKK